MSVAKPKQRNPIAIAPRGSGVPHVGARSRKRDSSSQCDSAPLNTGDPSKSALGAGRRSTSPPPSKFCSVKFLYQEGGEGELGELALQQVFSHFFWCFALLHLLTFLHFDTLPVSVRSLQSFGCGGGGGGEGEGEGDGGSQQVILQFFLCFFFLHSFLHFLGFCRLPGLHTFFSFLHGLLSSRPSQSSEMVPPPQAQHASSACTLAADPSARTAHHL